MSICIFCHENSDASRSVEHIIPESLGNKHHFLPKGYVCDKCNNYFSIKIERELLSQPYFVSMRFRNEISTKKGRLVKEKMILPGIAKAIDVTMQTTNMGRIMSFGIRDEELFDSIKNGRVKTLIGPYIPEPTYPNKIMSRFLAKCAYEYFLYSVGKDNYDLCVQELLGKENDILKRLREYARYGNGEYWQYNQRRIYSEGDIVFNGEDGQYYERLHEMKFFVKEYTKMSNDNISAEIYFVMAISGIEYAICISDPNITGYQKWIEDNDGISPLFSKAESVRLSLSEINPILINNQGPRRCQD